MPKSEIAFSPLVVETKREARSKDLILRTRSLLGRWD